MKGIKKYIFLIISMILIVLGSPCNNVYAYDTTVEIKINGANNGEVAIGDKVDIVINLKNITDLYAAGADYIYDNTVLQIDSIEVNADIEARNIKEAYRDTKLDGNRARYGFTLLGVDNAALNGNMNFITIKATAIGNGKISIDTNNMQMQLIGTDTKKMSFDFDNGDDLWSVTNTESINGDSSTQKVELIEKNENDDVNKEETDNQENNNKEEKGVSEASFGNNDAATEEATEESADSNDSDEEESDLNDQEVYSNDEETDENIEIKQYLNIKIYVVIALIFLCGIGIFIYMHKYRKQGRF